MKHDTLVTRSQSGFSLVELLVYMVILGILMAVVMVGFTTTLRRSVQQSGIAETQIETGVGLEILRTDLEHAGFGLPWSFQNPPAYNELAAPSSDAPGVPPSALNGDSLAANFSGSDRLIIRGANMIQGASGQRWGLLGRDSAHNVSVQSLGKVAFANTDWVIALNPGVALSAGDGPGDIRSLVMSGGAFAFPATAAGLANIAPDVTSNDPDGVKVLLYGINNAAPARPFNRTDYLIGGAAPAHCAPGTGVLQKATLNLAGPPVFNFLPIVDCVADFQVAFYLDTNGDGGWDTPKGAAGLAALTAGQIRDQVKEVRCYILLHEGGEDRSYTHPDLNNDGTGTIIVGEVDGSTGAILTGRAFGLAAAIGPTWPNYRWKVVNVSVAPKNLR